MTEKISKAVAIKYDKAKDNAPRVTATGKGEIADQIKALAKHYGIAIKEDTELVDILSLLEVNSLIPVEAYAAIAEILRYIYKVNEQSR